MSDQSFFSDILKPGSSLNPTFLLILDGTFALLLVVLLSLSYLTSGNFHIFALTFIELALWASVKWFVNELKNTLLDTTRIDEMKTDGAEEKSKKES